EGAQRPAELTSQSCKLSNFIDVQSSQRLAVFSLAALEVCHEYPGATPPVPIANRGTDGSCSPYGRPDAAATGRGRVASRGCNQRQGVCPCDARPEPGQCRRTFPGSARCRPTGTRCPLEGVPGWPGHSRHPASSSAALVGGGEQSP